MKAIRFFSLILICHLATASFIQAQDDSSADSTGLPGDQFSLEGALELFKKAGSPEAFEKLLNTESNHVNNLDLNEDGQTDYIRVIGKMENDLHIFVLQVPVSATENQDIAVLELEKNGDNSAIIQIIGDEDIYGVETIVEPQGDEDQAWFPYEEKEIQSGPYDDYTANTISKKGVVVNVWVWPAVRFVYAPGYRVWVSPWRFRAYPAWWRPWRPLGWRAFHVHRLHYRRGFVVVRTHRVVRAHRIYTPIRVHSVTVRRRHAVAVNNYRVTRTRTAVTGPRGNTVIKKTTTVTGRNGKVKAKRTKVRKKRG